jgi:hypothetical protein
MMRVTCVTLVIFLRPEAFPTYLVQEFNDASWQFKSAQGKDYEGSYD